MPHVDGSRCFQSTFALAFNIYLTSSNEEVGVLNLRGRLLGAVSTSLRPLLVRRFFVCGLLFGSSFLDHGKMVVV
jgi:hypothetical protein